MRVVFQLPLSSLYSVCPSCIQIRNPRGPYLDCAPGDLLRRGLLHMRGGKHGGEVGSVGHAHRAWSVRSATRVIYPLTADVFSFFFSTDFLCKISVSSFIGEQTQSRSVTMYPGSDFHLAFYPDLVFIIMPQADVPLKTVQTGRIILRVCVRVHVFLHLRSYNICTRFHF